MLRLYVRVMGIGLVLLGVTTILGMLGDVVGPAAGVLYSGTGGIFLYTGLGRMDTRDIRSVTGGMGVLYLASGVLVVALAVAYDLPFLSDYDFVDDYGRIAFGVLSIFAAGFLPCEEDPPATP